MQEKVGNHKASDPSSGPPPSSSADSQTLDGGQLFIESLSAAGIEYIFYNPGSDYYPILEHMARLEEVAAGAGRAAPNDNNPTPIMCLTEHLALCMAHGYSMLSNRAQVVLVHVGIGTLQLGGALHNAHRGNAPVLICAGRAPFTLENELEGGRESPYHWDQELFDQSASVREYTKWQYELKTNANMKSVVNRALQIANTEPKGPVYLVLPRELLAEKLKSSRPESPFSPSARFQAPARPEADASILQKMADLLINSESPIIITEHLGRDVKAVQALVNLSETLGVGVCELSRKRTNFPTEHPNYLPAFPKDAVESADLIFLVDVDVPWIPSTHRIRGDAKVIQLDIDPSKGGYPLWGFPVDLSATGSAALSLPKLEALVHERITSSSTMRERISERVAKLRAMHEGARAELARVAEDSLRSSRVMMMEGVLHLLNRVKSRDSIIVNEGVSYTRTVENYLDSSIPGTFFGLGGSSLGEAMGNALGLKLARRDRDVICVIGDGGYVYSNPTAVLWGAKRYDIPTLTLVINNGGYAAMKRSIDKFYPEGWSRRKHHYAGVRVEPQPDYLGIARACGASVWRVEQTSEVEEALSKGIFLTRTERQPCVIEIVLAAR